MRKYEKIARRFKKLERSKGFLILRHFLKPAQDPAPVILGLAHHIGTPSDIDGEKIIWPIKANRATGTFSERVGPAASHTDAAYLNPSDVPVNFILACIEEARAGGATRLLRSADVFDELANAGWQPAELQLLFDKTWQWYVPETFQTPSKPNPCEPKAILNQDGQMSWRYDNIVCATDFHSHVAEKFHRLLENSRRAVFFKLHPTDILICSNRYALHGRTVFFDRRRYLLRVRTT